MSKTPEFEVIGHSPLKWPAALEDATYAAATREAIDRPPEGPKGSVGDERYRWTLWRRFHSGQLVCVIMLNPSTADDRQDDPTIRKLCGFAKRWGANGIEVVNLFAMRATNPKDIKRALPSVSKHEVVGPLGLNDYAITTVAGRSNRVVAAWGAHGDWYNRADAVFCLLGAYPGFAMERIGAPTKYGYPRHPLYVPYSETLEPL